MTSASFEYQVRDSSGKVDWARATVSLPAPPAADARDDVFTFASRSRNGAYNLAASDLLKNDSGNDLSIFGVRSVSGGTAQLSNGSVTVQANSGSTSAVFEYQARGSRGKTDTATVQVSIPARLTKDDVIDLGSYSPGTPLSFNVNDLLRNDTSGLQVTKVETANGSVALNGSNIAFVPNSGPILVASTAPINLGSSATNTTASLIYWVRDKTGKEDFGDAVLKWLPKPTPISGTGGNDVLTGVISTTRSVGRRAMTPSLGEKGTTLCGAMRAMTP